MVIEMPISIEVSLDYNYCSGPYMIYFRVKLPLWGVFKRGRAQRCDLFMGNLLFTDERERGSVNTLRFLHYEIHLRTVMQCNCAVILFQSIDKQLCNVTATLEKFTDRLRTAHYSILIHSADIM